MVIKYQISPYPTLLEDLVVRIAEAQNDGAWVYVQNIPQAGGGGHPAINTITWAGADRVTHIVRLYGATSGNKFHEYTLEPKENVVTLFDPIRFKIGDGGPFTPLSGTSTYTNPILVGLTDVDYIVHRNGYGELFPVNHYTLDSVGGAFTLAQAGDVFGDDEEFTIRMQPKNIQTVVNDSVVGKQFGGFLDVAANLGYLPAHLRKLIRFSGTCTYTFAALDAIPIGYLFVFTHFGANGIGTISFLNAQLLWGGAPVASFQVKHLCEAAFVFDGVNWNVVWITQSAETTNAIQPGQIAGWGTYVRGDIPGGNPEYIVNHNLDIDGDYMVFMSNQTQVGQEANYHRNNTVTGTWWHDTNAGQKKNRFHFSPEQLTNEIQSLNFNWLIIKL